MICQVQHKKYLSRLFHAWHGCFTVSHLAAVACLSITIKWINRFSWNFNNRSVMAWETILNILGMMRLTPWIQGSLFIFCTCVYYQHHGITDGWIFMTVLGCGNKNELALSRCALGVFLSPYCYVCVCMSLALGNTCQLSDIFKTKVRVDHSP